MWRADDEGGFRCPLPGHSGNASIGLAPADPRGAQRLRCECEDRWRSLGEVWAAIAYGCDSKRTNIEIATWTRRLAQWRLRGDVFAYFNNDWCGYAPANAARLARSLPVGT